MSDGQLLDWFVSGREGGEAAFEALVERHGPMVLGICRRILMDPHDAQDAFQATFLVLLLRSGAIRDRDCLRGWLFGVASRVAAKARFHANLRRRHERRAAGLAAAAGAAAAGGRGTVG